MDSTKLKIITILFIIIYLITVGISIPKISYDSEKKELFTVNIQEKEEKEEPIGSLVIPKIHLAQPLYQKGSDENTIEKHVSFLKESTSPEESSSLIVLAAHSGEGEIAYFNDLDQLEINDSITLYYNEKEYTYEVVDIWEEKKNGYIHINREPTKQLILTTCSPHKEGFQLIINSTIKES